MGDNLEKTQSISSSYDPYANEDLGMSIAPQEAVPLVSSQADSPEDFFGTEPVSLDTPVQIGNSPQQTDLRFLLVSAGQGQPWAVSALENFLEDRLAPMSNMDMCYLSCEDNVGQILTQLRHGDAEQQREAAKSLLGIILDQTPDNGEDFTALRRGLLVAGRKISEITDSQIFNQEIAQLDPASKRQIVQLQNQNHVPENTNRTEVAQQSEAPAHGRETAAGPIGGAPALGKTQEASASVPLASVQGSSNFQTPVPSPASTLVTQVLQNALPEGSQAQRFLSESPAKALATRLTELVQIPSLSPRQLNESIYYAVLNTALRHPDVVSAEDHYGEIRPVARQIANAVTHGLGNGEPAITLANNPHHNDSPSTRNPTPDLPLHELSHKKAENDLSEIGFGSLLNLLAYTNQESAFQTALGTLANSSTVAAGMMAVNFMDLAGRPGFHTLSKHSTARDPYYIEDATNANGHSQGGSGQGSSGQNPGRDSQNPSRDDTVYA